MSETLAEIAEKSLQASQNIAAVKLRKIKNLKD